MRAYYSRNLARSRRGGSPGLPAQRDGPGPPAGGHPQPRSVSLGRRLWRTRSL